MNAIIKVTNKVGEITYFSLPAKNADKFVELIAEYDATHEIFQSGKMPLEALPEEIQNRVRETLKAFSECSVTYEYGKFTASTAICVKSYYHYDHIVCGRYKQSEVYTEEERRRNYKEVFG